MYLIRIKFGQIIITYTGTYINQFVVDTGSAILQGQSLSNLLLLDDRGLITHATETLRSGSGVRSTELCIQWGTRLGPNFSRKCSHTEQGAEQR